jgi:hypothetical protein
LQTVKRVSLLNRVAGLINLLAGLVLLGSAAYMITYNHPYEAAAALGGLTLLFFVYWITRRIFPGNLLPWLQILVVLILSEMIFLGTIMDFYDTIYYYDKTSHFLSGALLAVIGILIFYWINPQQRVRLTVRPGFISLFCIGFTMTGKVIWEFYEYTGDRILGSNMQRWQRGAIQGLTDTMLDLVVGMVGSLIVSILAGHQIKKDAERFYRNFIHGFFEHAKIK